MRIALICNEYPPRQHGGIGTFVCSVAPALAAAGHDVEVVELGGRAGVEDRGGIRVRTVPSAGRFKGAWLIDRWRLKFACERGGYDIVETPDFEGWLPWGLGGPVVVSRLHLSSSARCIADGVRPRRALVWRERSTLRRSDGWIAVSGASLASVGQTFPGLAPRPYRKVFCPLNVEAAGPGCAEIDGPFLLFAGYVARSKGADRLARVVRPVLEAYPTLRLVLAGRVLDADGEVEGMRKVVCRELGPAAASRCDFLGFVERARLHSLMRRAVAFVFPSRLETFGLVAGEAMMLGCPVVLPREPPFTEYVRDEETGLLCLGDAEWSAAVLRLVADEHLRIRLGRAGKLAAESDFSLETCVRETTQFYEQLLGAKRRLGK